MLGQRKTPGRATGGISENKPRPDQRSTTSSIPHTGMSIHDIVVDRTDFFGQQLNGIYIVVAQIQSPGPDQRFRRRFYANLPSAQRAVDRARMNGRDAYLYIGQIAITGGDHE